MPKFLTVKVTDAHIQQGRLNRDSRAVPKAALSGTCPIALALKDKGYTYVAVYGATAYIRHESHMAGNRLLLSRPASGFISDFDGGRVDVYPSTFRLQFDW